MSVPKHDSSKATTHRNIDMQKEILKNNEITASSEQTAKLKALFPSCFDASGRFHPDKLEELLRADGAHITREGYKLDWLGKSYARLLANLKTTTLLAPNTKHNTKLENTNSQNLLIQGDNLDVLKHLVNAYSEKIKVIYIDPPYNTGSDGFVYADDRKFTPSQLAGMAGLDEEEAVRILSFTNSNSNSHSAWLTFMYPRLYIARELLTDDGLIFISIDMNEAAQLKILCDEVFGEECFIGAISRPTGTRMGTGSRGLAKELDYILCFAKNNGELQRLPMTAQELALYDHADSKGKYLLRSLRRTGGENRREDRPSMFYPIKAPDGTKVFPIAPEGWESRWSCGKDTYDQLLVDDEIVWKNDDGNWKVYQKFYLKDGKKEVSDLWDGLDGNKKGTRETTSLFDGVKVFSNPKAIGLLTQILRVGGGKDDVFLDFFAGSGSTAHAIMKLNAEDGGSRKFILVQVSEPTGETTEARKSGYSTIFDITRDRIIRASKKIMIEYPNTTSDVGFKEFKTIPANEGAFIHYLNDAETLEDYVPFDGLALDDKALNALLTTWKIYDGLPLHQDLVAIDLGGYTAYKGKHILYFVKKSLELSHIKEMLRRIDEDDDFAPRKIVAFHHVLGDKMLREFSEAINAPNRKYLELTFEQRF